jgi:hypothetical protein
MAVRITCINKSGGYHDNPHEAITDFGWVNEQTGGTGKNTLAQMVKFLDVDKGSAYVKNATDNLLKLLECI